MMLHQRLLLIEISLDHCTRISKLSWKNNLTLLGLLFFLLNKRIVLLQNYSALFLWFVLELFEIFFLQVFISYTVYILFNHGRCVFLEEHLVQPRFNFTHYAVDWFLFLNQFLWLGYETLVLWLTSLHFCFYSKTVVTYIIKFTFLQVFKELNLLKLVLFIQKLLIYSFNLLSFQLNFTEESVNLWMIDWDR